MNNSTNPIRKLQNAEQGRTAFVLANGPSLLSEPLELLQDQLLIGMNGSTALEHDNGLVQNYYTVSDRRFLEHPEKGHWATTSLNPVTRRVLRADLRDSDSPVLTENTYFVPHLKRDGFSQDLAAGFFYGCTTTMLAIQLAAYLGCKSIFLLGVDLRYRPDQPRCYSESSPQVEDAFTSVQIWNVANAARVLRLNGVSLSNCSEHSLLRPYLPFVPFEEAVSSGAMETATQ
ncbi:MAG: 6-hydroxymethylpterin diphosphokinase MptE-like protein [Burkholderiaceae bacterium]